MKQISLVVIIMGIVLMTFLFVGVGYGQSDTLAAEAKEIVEQQNQSRRTLLTYFINWAITAKEYDNLTTEEKDEIEKFNNTCEESYLDLRSKGELHLSPNPDGLLTATFYELYPRIEAKQRTSPSDNGNEQPQVDNDPKDNVPVQQEQKNLDKKEFVLAVGIGIGLLVGIGIGLLFGMIIFNKPKKKEKGIVKNKNDTGINTTTMNNYKPVVKWALTELGYKLSKEDDDALIKIFSDYVHVAIKIREEYNFSFDKATSPEIFEKIIKKQLDKMKKGKEEKSTTNEQSSTANNESIKTNNLNQDFKEDDKKDTSQLQQQPSSSPTKTPESNLPDPYAQKYNEALGGGRSAKTKFVNEHKIEICSLKNVDAILIEGRNEQPIFALDPSKSGEFWLIGDTGEMVISMSARTDASKTIEALRLVFEIRSDQYLEQDIKMIKTAKVKRDGANWILQEQGKGIAYLKG